MSEVKIKRDKGHVILISGTQNSGKTTSLMNIRDPEGVLYLNFEAGKDLPFDDSGFVEKKILNPMHIEPAFKELEKTKYHTMIVDSMTFMMDMFETQYVLTADNKMSAWGLYEQFFKKIMQVHVANTDKNIVFIGHTGYITNEDRIREVKVMVKGSLTKQRSIESWFTNVLVAKRIGLDDQYMKENDYLEISEREKIMGYKYVFQTQHTPETLNENPRSKRHFWDVNEIYIDNDIQVVFDKLNKKGK